MNMVMQTKKIPKNSIETLIKDSKEIKNLTKKDKVFLMTFLSTLDIEVQIDMREKVRFCEPETFLYARAMLRRNISDDEALNIHNRSNTKLFIVWCLSKLAKIDILNKIYSEENYDNGERTDAGK